MPGNLPALCPLLAVPSDTPCDMNVCGGGGTRPPDPATHALYRLPEFSAVQTGGPRLKCGVRQTQEVVLLCGFLRFEKRFGIILGCPGVGRRRDWQFVKTGFFKWRNFAGWFLIFRNTSNVTWEEADSLPQWFSCTWAIGASRVRASEPEPLCREEASLFKLEICARPASGRRVIPRAIC